MKLPLKISDYQIPLFPGGGIGWYTISDNEGDTICQVFTSIGETQTDTLQRVDYLADVITRGYMSRVGLL